MPISNTPEQPTKFVAPLAQSDDVDDLIDRDGQIVGAPADELDDDEGDE